MSDQIGFHYQRYAAGQAVEDFVGRLEAIGNATAGNAGHRPTLVSIILDGENCWEYYPNSGLEFLRGLYRRIVAAPQDHAGAGARLPGPASGHGTSSATSFPAVGSSTTSGSGSAMPTATGRGTCCTKRGSTWSDAAPRTASRPSSSTALGKRCTSPRGATGSGGSTTRTSPPRAACSTASSASTCRTSICAFRTSRRASWPGRSAGAASSGSIRCRRACCTSKWTAGARTSSGSTPAATRAKARGGP